MVFEYLNNLRAFEAQYLGALQTSLDRDLVLLIGLHQQRGSRINITQIKASLGSPRATIERRLARLMKLGLISQVESQADGRCRDLLLSNSARLLFAQYGNLMRRMNKEIGSFDTIP